MRQLIDIILPAGIFFQIVLLCFILFIIQKNRPANRIFASILILFAMGSCSILLRNSEYTAVFFFFGSIHIPIMSLFGPCIFFYTRDMISHKKSRTYVNMLHFIAFFIILGISIVIHINIYHYFSLHSLPLRAKPDILTAHRELAPYAKIIIFFIGYGLVSSSLYTIYSWILLKRYANKIEEFFSNLQRVSLNWLTFFITIISLLFLVGNVIFWGHIFGLITRAGQPHFMFTMINILQMLLIFSATYFIITKPDIFKEIDEMEEEIGTADDTITTPQKGKYEKQNISREIQQQYLSLLTSYMANKKPYLEDSLTLKELAETLEIPGHHLSIVINTQLGKNFYSFINEYRVKEVVSILNNPNNHDANILSIAFRSGFNSKSTFNNVFKKVIGKTPSEYRESLLARE